MKRDQLFLDADKGVGTFEFNEEVAEVFDDMLQRSVPFYLEQQAMIRGLCKSMRPPDTTIYDLGCSTATTLIGLAAELPADVRLIGYDNSLPMLARARAKIDAAHLKDRIELRHGDLNQDPCRLSLEDAGIVTMAWTLQFVRPSHRASVIKWIYDSLAPSGGIPIVTEKILTNRSDLDRRFIELYHEYKRGRGYLDVEIARKREALENVLVPYRIEENIDLFRRAGFEAVETFFQWFNFAGFLCLKQPASSQAG